MALQVPLADAHIEQLVLPDRERPASRPAFPSWPFLVLAVPIVSRAAILATALIAEPWTSDPNRIIPAWSQILQASFFASLAFVLLFYGRADRRAWSLGLFILDSAGTLVEPFVRGVADPSALTWLGLHLRTDAFQAALVWFFASEFPRPSRNRRLARVFTAATGIAMALGVLLAGMDAYAVTSSAVTPANPLLDLAVRVQRVHPGRADWYFTLQFLLLAPLLLLQPWKLREWGADDRRRFVWLVAALATGFAPLIAVALLATFSPSSLEVLRPYWRLVGAVIVIALTLVPVSAAYASLVQRTLDLRLVVRAALQYLFARSVIRAIAALPLAALALLVFTNREQPIAALVTGSRGLSLGLLAVAGAGGMVARKHLLSALDRGFFREQFDARETLLHLVESARRASTLSELCETTAAAVAKAFHPQHACIFVAASDDAFHPQDADLQALPRSSALAQLVEGGDTPFVVGEGPDAAVTRLNVHERAWLASARARLLVPLCGGSGQLLGIMALGEKKSELPYTSEDRTLLAAVGSACGLALDRALAVERQSSTPNALNLINPPARECVECGTVLDADAKICVCGGLVRRAPVPHVLDDRLRFVQRVGAGGMGVVYRAIDLRLQQVRAVKTLAGTDPAMVARLRREARAMAVATHVNLATLYGLEIWRGSPMLVMEFLDGGTLANRLRRGPLPVEETLALGAMLAQAVGVLHATGTLHRDIKPSNIGFTVDGVPKLLDFGLAKLLTRPVPPTGGHATDDSTHSMSYSTEVGGIRGTPSYLSPDVLSGAHPSPADDLWSLAVTLLEACTGANPFRAASVAATVARVMTDTDSAARAAADLPDPVRRLFADLLGPRDRRPDTAYELVRRLKQERAAG